MRNHPLFILENYIIWNYKFKINLDHKTVSSKRVGHDFEKQSGRNVCPEEPRVNLSNKQRFGQQSYEQVETSKKIKKFLNSFVKSSNKNLFKHIK